MEKQVMDYKIKVIPESIYSLHCDAHNKVLLVINSEKTYGFVIGHYDVDQGITLYCDRYGVFNVEYKDKELVITLPL